MYSPSIIFKLKSSVLSESVELHVSSNVKEVSSQEVVLLSGNSLP